MQIAMVQDKIVPASELDPVYSDRGMYFGDGVYEVMRSYNGKLFALEEHLQRFARSMAAIEITGVDIEVIRARVLRAFEAAGIANAKIYFQVTHGSGPRDRIWGPDLKPNFFLTVSEVGDSSKEKAKGIAVSTFPDWRWKRCDIKSLNLLANVLASNDAARKGCAEAILVDQAGLVTEGSGSAFFAVMGKALQTAPLTANILPSITREFAIKAARNIGLKVIEETFTPAQAAGASELFLAVTTKDIVPVVKFDGTVIGDSKPGRYTKQIAEEFRSFTL